MTHFNIKYITYKLTNLQLLYLAVGIIWKILQVQNWQVFWNLLHYIDFFFYYIMRPETHTQKHFVLRLGDFFFFFLPPSKKFPTNHNPSNHQ